MYNKITRRRTKTNKRSSKKRVRRNKKTKRYNKKMKMKGGTRAVELVPGKFYTLHNINPNIINTNNLDPNFINLNNVDPNSIYEFIHIIEKTAWENRAYYDTIPDQAVRWEQYLNGDNSLQFNFVFTQWINGIRAEPLVLYLHPTDDIGAREFNTKRQLRF